MSYKVGSRSSNLSSIQTEEVLKMLREKTSKKFLEKDLDTLGDKERWKEIQEIDETGVFTGEIDKALLAGDIDIAVHSTKDVPTEFSEKMAVGAVCRRKPPNDVIIGGRIDELEPGSRIGTGSPRRKEQILRIRPDLEVIPIRGNVETRIGKIGGKVDAVVLAEVGVRRMDMDNLIDQVFNIEDFLPAPGQAALTVMCRKEDRETYNLLRKIDHEKTRKEVEAERSVLREMGQGCSVPLGTYAEMDKDVIKLVAEYFPDSHRVELEGSAEKPTEIGVKAAEIIKQETEVK